MTEVLWGCCTVAIWSYADKNLVIYGSETHLNACKYSAEILVMLVCCFSMLSVHEFRKLTGRRCTDEFEITDVFEVPMNEPMNVPMN